MNMPPIPDFLLRKQNKSRFKAPQMGEVMPSGMSDTHENKSPLTKKRSLTNSFKEKLATDIITYVSKGFNTFGKLRKVLSDHPSFGKVEDREIKSAIRYSLTNRIPTGKVIGKGKTRHLAIKYKMLTKNYKTYNVIEL
tara:strand:- start:538 stop:951 length:414 start_codon:yes stop_codon:yes gene_type:complete